MPSVNPDILEWARTTAGLTLEDAARKLGIGSARGVEPAERLSLLETGEVVPTRPMLVKMAKQYRRPLLTFYLSAPPKTADRGEDFRTLPEALALTDNALVDAVVRDLRARQELVRVALEDEDEAKALPFVGSAKSTDKPQDVARSISETLAFDLQGYRKCRTIGDAVTHLRSEVEAAGIFVIFVDNLGNYLTEIPVEIFRGFALSDDVAPFIAVNANDSKGAQAFTIAHELAHIWLGLTGVSGRLAERSIEKFCNDVAGAFLLPEGVADLNVTEGTPLNDAVRLIADFASARNISSTMVAYALHREGAFSFSYFDGIARTFRSQFMSQRSRERELSKEKDGGPTYPNIRRHRAGPALVSFVNRMLSAGALTTLKAGKVLGVSGKNVQGVLNVGGPGLS